MLRILALALALLAGTDALSVGGVVTPTAQATTSLNALLARRSVAKYDVEKAVPTEAVDRALEAVRLPAIELGALAPAQPRCQRAEYELPPRRSFVKSVIKKKALKTVSKKAIKRMATDFKDWTK